MRILVTGAAGFVGKNLLIALAEAGYAQVKSLTRSTSAEAARDAVSCADVIVHLAGTNRPHTEAEFDSGNRGLAEDLADAVRAAGHRPDVLFASSIQAERDNPYGRSKRAAEEAFAQLAREGAANVAIYRLPNLFGKWCRPNYNSVVANFCAAAAAGQPLRVDDPAASLRLVYIDDLVADLLRSIDAGVEGLVWPTVAPEYQTTVGALAGMIRRFAGEQNDLYVGKVGDGMERGLYATYLSYLDPKAFDYALTEHRDARGAFIEVVKTAGHGQVSYFTSRPGVVRGCHYHHTKTEKFVVVQGQARFRSRHLITGERVDVDVDAAVPRVVQTIPGWTHDVVNTGDEELVVLVWANEVFDPEHPDTMRQMVEQ